MTINFRCKNCGSRYQYDDVMAGENFNCKDCSAQMEVPRESEIDTVADKSASGKANAAAPTDNTDTVIVPSVTWATQSADDIKFACKICGHKYRLAKIFAGRCAECAKCKRVLIIPAHSDEAPPGSKSGEITFWCKACGQKYRLPQQYAGNSAHCSRCSEVFVVPDVSENAPARAPGQQSALETKHDLHKARERVVQEALTSKSLQTQTSVEITGNPVSMVRYVLASSDHNIAASAFFALIDWISRFPRFKSLPRTFIGMCIILCCIAAVIAVFCAIYFCC